MEEVRLPLQRLLTAFACTVVFALVAAFLSLGCMGAPDQADCPATNEQANSLAHELEAEFREHFAADVRIPDWCFASDDDYREIADRLIAICGVRPASARAEGLALIALKAGRCVGFEAGRRSTLGGRRRAPVFGQEPNESRGKRPE